MPQLRAELEDLETLGHGEWNVEQKYWYDNLHRRTQGNEKEDPALAVKTLENDITGGLKWFSSTNAKLHTFFTE